MRKILLTIILGILLFSLVSANDIGPYPKDEPLNISVTCNNGPEYCSSEAVCNINVIDPLGKLIVFNQNMTNNVSIHLYEITPDKTGCYGVSGLCSDGNLGQPISFIFCVNPTGSDIEKPESNFYFIILFLILLLLGLFVTIVFNTTFKNKEEDLEEGIFITAVTKSKYVKLMSIWISYGLFLIFVTMINGISNNYIFFEGVRNIISNLQTFLSILGWGVNLAMMGILIWLTWSDIVLNKTILREGKKLLSRNGK